MTKVMWKFKLEGFVGYPFVVAMPKGAIIRHVNTQDHTSMLWAECDPDAELETREFLWYGTGHTFNPNYVEHYVATLFEGPFVWHLYERKGRIKHELA
jgi:hypothetical protein